MADNALLADWIKEFRYHLDLTQDDFAARIGVSTATVQQWEYGRFVPKRPTLLLLARMAHESGFEPAPEVTISRKPRRTKRKVTREEGSA